MVFEEYTDIVLLGSVERIGQCGQGVFPASGLAWGGLSAVVVIEPGDHLTGQISG